MKLADFLAQKGMTHVEFARAIGVTQVAVTRYVAGTRTPRRECMRRIRTVTGGAVTADDFADLEAAE